MQRINWFNRDAWLRGCSVTAVLALGAIGTQPAQALPLFARQTGEACMACHTVYPELTHFGRMFKLNGYQLDNGKDLQVTTDEGNQQLALPVIPNLALFVMVGDVQLAKPLPDSQILGAHSLANGGIELP